MTWINTLTECTNSWFKYTVSISWKHFMPFYFLVTCMLFYINIFGSFKVFHSFCKTAKWKILIKFSANIWLLNIVSIIFRNKSDIHENDYVESFNLISLSFILKINKTAIYMVNWVPIQTCLDLNNNSANRYCSLTSQL